MKRTLLQRIWHWLNGYEYILNTRTHELHVIKNITRQCGVQYMSKRNKLFLSEHDLAILDKKGYKVDGCIHCNESMNTD